MSASHSFPITTIPTKSASEIREDLLAGREIALLDVREEGPHAKGHPLFAANLSFSRIELDAYTRLPRKGTQIVIFDDGEGLAEKAAAKFLSLGYQDVRLLEGGLQGWRDAGYVLFRDVNAPSKAFGELVETRRHTPSLSAEEVKSLIDGHEDVVIVDARRFDEYHTMSIPTAISVPGGELVLRVRELAPNPETRVIVNCAGRTRGIIGTQSLINSGLPNKVAALRNGTIGWKLAKQQLEYGQTRRFLETRSEHRTEAAIAAQKLAERAGVRPTTIEEVDSWIKSDEITVYRFDVRNPEEFASGRLNGYRNAPGGQLVQETDMFVPVRHARIVLVDQDGVRANMTASWLAQMNWKVFVVKGLTEASFTDTSRWPSLLPPLPSLPHHALISPSQLHAKLQDTANEVVVLDFARSSEYAKTHLASSRFALLSRLDEALRSIDTAKEIVLTSPDGNAAQVAWREAVASTDIPVLVLAGGTDGWRANGYEVTDKGACYASSAIDRYHRPYEGTDVRPEVMQAYLDWEFGLVEQLDRDGTHGFWVF